MKILKFIISYFVALLLLYVTSILEGLIFSDLSIKDLMLLFLSKDFRTYYFIALIFVAPAIYQRISKKEKMKKDKDLKLS